MPSIEFLGFQESDVDGIEAGLLRDLEGTEGLSDIVSIVVHSRVRMLASQDPSPMIRLWRSKNETGDIAIDPAESPEDRLVEAIVNWFTSHGLDVDVCPQEEYHPGDLPVG